MGKKVLLLAVLLLAAPFSAFASSNYVFTNMGGSLTGSDSGLSLSGSNLIIANGFGGLVAGANLGDISLSTGSLLSGSIQGGTFDSGGSFTITGNGSSGIPAGTLFTGTFSQPVTWTMTTLSNGTHSYTLTGTIDGTMLGGTNINGATLTLTFNTGKGFFSGSNLVSASTATVSVPEPTTLGFVGLGLAGLVGSIRRKMKA